MEQREDVREGSFNGTLSAGSLAIEVTGIFRLAVKFVATKGAAGGTIWKITARSLSGKLRSVRQLPLDPFIKAGVSFLDADEFKNAVHVHDANGTFTGQTVNALAGPSPHAK
jgi:hypothetical protein